MLLPLGVKILWFVLSLTGLLGCWIVLIGLGRNVNSRWAAVLYCVGCTILQGIVCLGMVWKMDPLSMPGRFCTAQSVLIALGSFVMTGTICVCSYTTYKVVLKPKTWADSSHEPLNWRPAYAIPTVLFPLAALALHVALIVKLKSVIPAIEFYCDASSPQWVRFLSYAGTPLLLYIPSLILSTKSILAIQETQRHIRRALTSEFDPDTLPGTPPPSPSNPTDCYTNSFKRRARGWSQSLAGSREQHRLKEKQSVDDMETHVQLGRDTPSRFKSLRESSSTASLRFSMSAFPSRTSKSARVPSPLHPVTAVHFQLPAKPPLRLGARASNATGVESVQQDRGESSSSPEPSLSSSGLSSPMTTHTVVSTGYSALSFPESSNDTIQIAEIERGASSLGSYTDSSSRNRDGVHPPELEGRSPERSSKDSALNDDSDIKSTHSSDKGGEHDEDAHSSTEFELGEVKTSEGHNDDGEGDEHTLSDEMGTIRVLPQVRTHMKQINNDQLYGRLPPLFRVTRRPAPPSLPSEIWRLILFQIAFVIVQILGSLSTLVDVARRHPAPSPLGTHHFSLLFAAWGPVMFFGGLQSVRFNILPSFLRRTPKVDSSS